MTDKVGKRIDYLDEDAPVPGQKWVCVSFLSPEGIRNCTVRGLKIRGVYDTKEEADQRAQDLQQIDPDFDVFVGEVGKWLPWDPEPNDENKVKDQVYQEQELQNLMKGYKENLAKAKRLQQQRKSDMMQQAQTHQHNQNQPSGNKTKDRLRRKLEERKKQQEKEKADDKMNKLVQKQEMMKSVKQLELESKEKEIEEKEKMSEADKEKLQMSQREIYEKNKHLESIDERLEKINELYAKLNKKKQEQKSENKE